MKGIGKKEMCIKYGVDPKTLRRWLANVPNLKTELNQKLFTPAQVILIEKHLGPMD